MTDFLKLLRRVPDDVILSMATREIDPDFGPSCLCGWAIREELCALVGSSADDPDSAYGQVAKQIAPVDMSAVSFDVEPHRCQALFGGRLDAWQALFWGITREAGVPVIETAFAMRVLECV